MKIKTTTILVFLLAMGLCFITYGSSHGGDENAADTDYEPQIKVAILIAEGFHDGETLEPKEFLELRGISTTLIGKKTGEATAYNSDVTVDIEKTVEEVSVDDFNALIIPGGRGPSRLREDDNVLTFVREFVESGKPVAAICHGPQVLISAGVVEGVEMTCFPGMKDELIEAEARYEDVAVQRDDNIITSRVPGDLNVFNEAILEALLEQL